MQVMMLLLQLGTHIVLRAKAAGDACEAQPGAPYRRSVCKTQTIQMAALAFCTKTSGIAEHGPT